MSWARLDDRANGSAKILALSDGAFRLWACGLIYCQANLTDGFIPLHAIGTFGVRARGVGQLTRELTRSHVPGKSALWHTADGGYQIHDYFDWNESRDDVLKARAETKERIEKYRARRREQNAVQNALQNDVHNDVQNDEPHAVRNATSTTTPTSTSTPTSTPRKERGGRARESTAIAPVWNANGKSAHGQALVRRHLKCYPSAACERGICLPEKLGDEWAQQFTDPADARREITATVADAIAKLGDGPVGDDPWQFWRAVWRHRHGTRAPSAGASRSGDTVSAARDYLREQILGDPKP